jgi:hypothetical protein
MGPNTAADGSNDALSDERRDLQRIFPTEPLQGTFTLHVGPQTLEITRLRDVSPFGLGVEAQQAAAPGATALLVYEQAGERLEVRGTVLWAKTMESSSADTSGPHYQLGLKLDPSEVANNLRFYRGFTTP